MPTYAWLIDHPEGIIVVDTGQGAHLLEYGKSLHPYVCWEVAFRIEREQEIGPQLRMLDIGPRDVKRVVLTHLHMDHDGGLAHFPNSEILVASGELKTGSGFMGRQRGYLPQRWPSWFDPKPLDLAAEPFGPFSASRRLTAAGDVVAVATPGHTADHISVIVQDGGTAYFLAGDTSYNEELMLAGRLDGVSADEQVSGATLDATGNSPNPAPRCTCRRTIRRPPGGWRSVRWLQSVKLCGPARRREISAGIRPADEAIRAVGDPREGVCDPEARYFGTRVEERSLVPLAEARLGRIGLDEWLRRSQAAA